MTHRRFQQSWRFLALAIVWATVAFVAGCRAGCSCDCGVGGDGGSSVEVSADTENGTLLREMKPVE